MDNMTVQVPLQTFLNTTEVLVGLNMDNINLKKALLEVKRELERVRLGIKESYNDGASSAEYSESDSERDNGSEDW